jgi:hypothetical protein
MKDKDLELLDAINYIEYNPDTGVINRLGRKNSNGSIDAYGYLIIKIKGNQFKAHRLAYAKYYGKAPNGVIDHINRNKLDNRIINLRDTSQRNNILNRDYIPNSKTNVVGVYIDNTNGLKKKYATKINKKTYRFYSIEEAINFKQNYNTL